ncbi:hypothetical protein BC567DRAFT_262255 [Phyllosticta citribraziliensis]
MADWRAWVRKIRQKTKAILRRRSGRKHGTPASANSTGGNTSSNTVVRHAVNTGQDSGSTFEDMTRAATSRREDAESCRQLSRATSANSSTQYSAVAASDAPTLPPIYHTADPHPPSRAPTFKERLRACSAHHPNASNSTTDTKNSRATDAEIRDLRPEEVGTRRYRMLYANEPCGNEDGGLSDEELTKPCPQSERSFEL